MLFVFIIEECIETVLRDGKLNIKNNNNISRQNQIQNKQMAETPWNSLIVPAALFASSGFAVALIRRLTGANDISGSGNEDDDDDNNNQSLSRLMQYVALAPGCNDPFYDINAHALSVQNDPSQFTCGGDCECECGFGRDEFKKMEFAELAYHDKHVFICRGMKSTDWVPNIEKDDPVCKAFSRAFRKIRKSVRVRVNIIEEGTKADVTDNTAELVDLLVFPDGIRYIGVRQDQVDALVNAHFVENKTFADVPHEAIDGSHVFVCCHQYVVLNYTCGGIGMHGQRERERENDIF